MIVRIAPRARVDLLDAADWIARDNPQAARHVMAGIDRVIEQLATRQLEGPEARMIDGRLLRRWSVPPFRIYYRRTPRTLEIVRVYHQARRPIER